MLVEVFRFGREAVALVWVVGAVGVFAFYVSFFQGRNNIVLSK